MESPKFKIGDKVFAKVRGWPPWPAKVEGKVEGNSNKVIKYNVYFYGTKQNAICREIELFPYVENKKVYGKPRKHKGFNASLLEIDSELNSSNSNDVTPFRNDTYSDRPTDLSGNTDEKTVRGENHSNKKSKQTNNSAGIGTVSELQKQTKENNYELLSLLKKENQLLDIDYQIQNSLCLNKADPDNCLKQLDYLSALEINVLMIKKYPEIVSTLQKLLVYVGNIDCWNMSNDQAVSFSSKARIIQQKSKIIYDKIQTMFSLPFGKTFTEVFEEELNKFKNCTQNMNNEDFYRLTIDPTN